MNIDSIMAAYWFFRSKFKKSSMKNTSQIQEEYGDLHSLLEDHEKAFQSAIADYATGGETIIADLDEIYRKMKLDLRKVRALALEYKSNQKDSSDAE